MGSQVFDGEVKRLRVLEERLEQRVYCPDINLFFNFQLVMIREVERDRQVGLPHAALHVVHGKGVGAGGQTFNFDRVFLVVICLSIIIFVSNFRFRLCIARRAIVFIVV